MTGKSGGAYSRNRGIRGEREARDLLEKHTGVYLRRNGSKQSEDGGCDLVLVDVEASGFTAMAKTLDKFAIEVKNTKDGFTPRYWKQCVEQADTLHKTPLLLYKVPLKGFRVAIRAIDLLRFIREVSFHNPSLLGYSEFGIDDIVHTTVPVFCKIVGIYRGDESERS